MGYVTKPDITYRGSSADTDSLNLGKTYRTLEAGGENGPQAHSKVSNEQHWERARPDRHLPTYLKNSEEPKPGKTKDSPAAAGTPCDHGLAVSRAHFLSAESLHAGTSAQCSHSACGWLLAIATLVSMKYQELFSSTGLGLIYMYLPHHMSLKSLE